MKEYYGYSSLLIMVIGIGVNIYFRKNKKVRGNVIYLQGSAMMMLCIYMYYDVFRIGYWFIVKYIFLFLSALLFWRFFGKSSNHKVKI